VHQGHALGDLSQPLADAGIENEHTISFSFPTFTSSHIQTIGMSKPSKTRFYTFASSKVLKGKYGHGENVCKWAYPTSEQPHGRR
jgi:hypothetical protein